MTRRSWRRIAIAAVAMTAAGRTSRAQPAPPADPPMVELYTMGQGDLLFEKFGHAALCLSHRKPRRSICFNYGTTDFDSVVPLFWDFLRGRSLFWVSTSSRGAMVRAYREADRTLWRQVLDLPPAAAFELESRLLSDAQEENRYYQYHHFRDNCSTRLRDHLDAVTGGALSAPRAGAGEHPTYRQLTRRGFAGDVWLLMVSDILLGRGGDESPSTYAVMFLPDLLRAEVAARLGAEPRMIYQRRGPDFPTDPGTGGRWIWFAIAIAIAAPIALARRLGRGERAAVAVAAAVLALFGLLLWFIAVVSPLPELRWNEALLVFVPTDAALPFLREATRLRYARLRIGMLVLVSILDMIGLLWQPLWALVPIPLLPLLALVLMRTRDRTGAAEMRSDHPTD